MQASTILVTGANGFLGRNVALLSSHRGYRVIGIGHGEWSRNDWEKWGLSQWRSCDLTLDALRGYVEISEAIIHCAGGGLVSFSTAYPIADFERTVVTTAHVLESIRQTNPSCRVVYPSSASVYGNAKEVPIGEECRTQPISQYGVHKLMAELMVNSYAKQFGVPAAIVRLFSLYGCGLRKQLLWDACCTFAKGDRTFMGTGSEVRDWLHIQDAAELLVTAVEHASIACPIVNGGSGVGTSVRELLAHLVWSFSGTKLEIEFSGARREGDPSQYVANINAAKAWGWSPKLSLMEGIAEYATWWKSKP